MKINNWILLSGAASIGLLASGGTAAPLCVGLAACGVAYNGLYGHYQQPQSIQNNLFSGQYIKTYRNGGINVDIIPEGALRYIAQEYNYQIKYFNSLYGQLSEYGVSFLLNIITRYGNKDLRVPNPLSISYPHINTKDFSL